MTIFCRLGSAFALGVFLLGGLIQAQPVAPASPEAAAEWARTLPQNGRMQALHGVVAGWADSDPAAAIQWAKNLDEQDQWVLSSVITAWGRKDPVAASRWIMQAPEEPERTEWLQNLGQAWGGKDRTKAAKWGESLKNPEEKAAFFGGIAFSFAMSEPEAGIRWAEALTDPKNRKAGILQALRAWSFLDKPAAEKWVRGLAEGDLKIDAQEVLKNRMVPRRIFNGSAAAAKNRTLSFETPAELAKVANTPLNQIGRAHV